MNFALKLLAATAMAGTLAGPVCGAEALAPAPAPATAPAPGEMPPEYTWFNGDDDTENASLVYGNRESAEDITLALNCKRRSGTVNLFVAETSEKLKPGQKVTVALSIGTAKASAKGKMTANEMAGVPSAEATIPADAPVFAAMTEPAGAVAVNVADWKTSVTLKGIGAKGTEFAATCRK